jgi:hypothetical protein
MTLLESCLLFITAAALLWTKALDVISTWRLIGAHGESNPIARWLFEKAGLAGGISIVCALYIVILSAQLGVVFWINSPGLTFGTVLIGFLVAFIQYDVARYNRTRRHSVMTNFLLCFLCGSAKKIIASQCAHQTSQKDSVR